MEENVPAAGEMQLPMPTIRGAPNEATTPCQATDAQQEPRHRTFEGDPRSNQDTAPPEGDPRSNHQDTALRGVDPKEQPRHRAPEGDPRSNQDTAPLEGI